VLEQFVRQNRWWTDPTTLKSDRHLRRLEEAPLRWLPTLPFRLDRDAVYTLRGPRQVGKSTVLKRQVAQLLAEGWPARTILYLDVELAGIDHARDLTAAIRAYLDDARATDGSPTRLAVLLDEVTRVPNWAGAVRGLVDNGELDGVTVIATGSHTADLQHGGERLPGRRGGGDDLDAYLLPLAFREYVQLLRPDLTLPPLLTSLEPDIVAASSLDRVILRQVLTPLFVRYLQTGGYLTVINDLHAHDMVRAETYEQYREALVGEFTRAAMRESYLREVITWLSSHLGQEFSPGDLARDTDIGSKDTARHYVDHLENTYATLQVYRTSSLTRPEPAFRAPRKVHPIDPFIFHLLRAWAVVDPDPWPATNALIDRPEEAGHLVESIVMVHLRRAFGDHVFYWRPEKGKEIDAVVVQPGQRVGLLEVKYRQHVDRSDLEELRRAGGGLVLSRDTDGSLDDGRIYQLPVAEFLACLDTPALTTRRRASA